MPNTSINVRVDTKIKGQAQEVFASMGMDMSSAINIFLRQVILNRCIPFTITAKPTVTAVKPQKPLPAKGKPMTKKSAGVKAEGLRDTMEMFR